MLGNEGATAEVETEAEAPRTMEDTIRETLASIRDRGDSEEPEVEVDTESADDGAEVDDGETEETDDAGETETEDAPQERRAPNTWRKEVAAKWATLPPDVQAEVERREADFHKGIEKYKSAAAFQDEVQKAVAPYVPTFRSLGISPAQAIQGLMSTDSVLRHGTPHEKLATFQSLAQQYGIDLGEAQNFQGADPQVSALQQQIQQLQSYLQQQETRGQQAEQAAVNTEIARFASNPKNRHFEQVREHMAALLQAGLATDLQDAYSQAVYANPQTRAAVQQQRAKASKGSAAQAAKAAKQAASVNVRSRPAMAPEMAAGQTIDDTIRATLRRLRGA